MKKGFPSLIPMILIIAVVLPYVMSSGFDVNADTNDISAFVARLYEICLEGEPDQGGLNNWVDSARIGKSVGFRGGKRFCVFQ